MHSRIRRPPDIKTSRDNPMALFRVTLKHQACRLQAIRRPDTQGLIPINSNTVNRMARLVLRDTARHSRVCRSMDNPAILQRPIPTNKAPNRTANPATPLPAIPACRAIRRIAPPSNPLRGLQLARLLGHPRPHPRRLPRHRHQEHLSRFPRLVELCLLHREHLNRLLRLEGLCLRHRSDLRWPC